VLLVTPLEIILLFFDIMHPTLGFGNVLPRFLEAIS
jgi:hypothetical protein